MRMRSSLVVNHKSDENTLRYLEGVFESGAPSEVEELYNVRMIFVYMIKNSADKLYTGITENPEERVQYHNKKQGAKFTKYISNFEIVFLEQYESMQSARKREIQIKKWRRNKKEFLIAKFKRGLATKV